MSMHQNPIGPSPGRYSKRKRVQVDYYERDLDEEHLEDIENGDLDEDSLQTKKRKVTRSPRPLPKHKIFPFLKLPAEIRNIIYEHCLHDPQGIYLTSTTEKYRRTVIRSAFPQRQEAWEQQQYGNSSSVDGDERGVAKSRRLIPFILAVNKQLYGEAREMLYGNEFHFEDTLTLHSYIVNIGPRAASLVKHITFRTWGGWRGTNKAYNHACFAVLASATNIQKLRINGWLRCKQEPKSVARQIYRDSFQWLETVGAAQGRVDAAVDLIEISPNNFGGHGWPRRNNTGNDTERNMQDFRQELSRLLGAREKRIRTQTSKKVSKPDDFEL